MIKNNFKCKLCGSETILEIRTSKEDYETNNCIVLDKNNDGTFTCEVNAKCDNCRITQRIYMDINFK